MDDLYELEEMDKSEAKIYSGEGESLLVNAKIVTSSTHARSWRANVFLALLTIFSATGGFLFGYDTGVVSGAMLLIDREFSLTPLWHELIVGVTIGCAGLSAAIAGFLCDLLGRKPVLMVSSVIFTLGAVVMGAAINKYMLLVGRGTVGVAIGFAAMAVPMYIAECAPLSMRGKLVVLNNLFITTGQFIATLLDGAFASVAHGWKYMLGLAGVPSLCMFVGFLFLPESPRWLVYHGKEEKALKVLTKLRAKGDIDRELQDIVTDHEKYLKNKLGCKDFIVRFFTTRTVLLALMVGCSLQAFQQLSGINTVMYYSASIIQMAGFDDRSAIWLAAVPAFGNAIFTVLGLVLVDRVGRRKLLLGSLVGVIFGFLVLSVAFVLSDLYTLPATPLSNSSSCSYGSCGACVGNSQCGFCVVRINESTYYNGTCSLINSTASDQRSVFTLDTNNTCGTYSDLAETNVNLMDTTHLWFNNSCPSNQFAWLTIVALFMYIMFFAPGMGPLPWTINSEIYPTWARSTAIAIATSTNWIFNLIVSLTFLSTADALGQPVTFGLYACLGFLGLVFFTLFVPETRGVSLEEVEKLFQRPHFLNWCQRKIRYSLVQSKPQENGLQENGKEQ